MTGQVTAQTVTEGMYGRRHLASRPPVGFAIRPYYAAVNGLLHDFADARDAIDAQEQGAYMRARRAKLVAFDRLAMVILGDPIVCLPRA